MKKVLVLGSGAQGTTVAQRLNEEEGVGEIICADHDEKAVLRLENTLSKASAKVIDARNKDEIVAAARGTDLIVNALPLPFGKNVLEAALEVGANYQDFAACSGIHEIWKEGVKILLTEYSERFREAGVTAVIGTGSAPGLICAVARRAVMELDSCHTITMMVYEGVEAKRFLPFWWSPETALSDMSLKCHAFENGGLIQTEPFSRPIERTFDYIPHPVTMVEHCHDEPVQMGINSIKYFKGANNIYFKYGGAGVNFALPLYRAGLLSRERVTGDAGTYIPFNVILDHLPPAPKYTEEIREILDEGLVSDEGAMVVEAIGMKDGREVTIEAHVFAPGLAESFEKAGITAEMYLTGQGGFLFSKMFVNDKFTEPGLFSSDMLSEEQVDYYLASAKQLGIDVEVRTS